MENVVQNIHFVKIATATNQTEAIKIRLLMDRTMIQYRVVNETQLAFFNPGFGSEFSAIEFQVPSDQAQIAIERLSDLFEIHGDAIPEKCPACETVIGKNQLDCPSCGLFLC